MFEVAGPMQSSLQTERKSRQNDAHARLLERVAASADRAAFTELFDHYGPILKSFMMGKGASADLAEDLAQDTMVQVWRKASLYSSGKGSVSSWIFTIARNLRIDAFRRSSRVSFEEISDFEIESDEPSGEDSINERQENAIVADAVKTLPPDQYQVIQMAFIEDLTHMEIAEKLNQPLGTVKSRMRLAYQKLSLALEDLR